MAGHPRENLFTSHGVIPALYELTGYLCKSDEKVLMLTPSYAYFMHAAEHNNIGYVTSDLVNTKSDGYYEIDFEDFERKATDPKVTLCIFCNPHNPSGRIWTEDELRRVAEICFKHNVFIISDEIHCDLIRSGQTHTPMAKLFPIRIRSLPAWRRARPSTWQACRSPTSSSRTRLSRSFGAPITTSMRTRCPSRPARVHTSPATIGSSNLEST